MRRGTLTIGARFCERTFALDPEGVVDPPAWAARRNIYAHILIRLGDFARAGALLKEIDNSGHKINLQMQGARLLTGATLALESEDVEGCCAAWRAWTSASSGTTSDIS
jgi:hypothetical protein